MSDQSTVNLRSHADAARETFEFASAHAPDLDVGRLETVATAWSEVSQGYCPAIAGAVGRDDRAAVFRQAGLLNGRR
jgi:hypothetical protein